MAKIGIDCRFYSENFGIGRYIIALLNELSVLDQDNQYYLFLNEDGYQNYQIQNPNFHKVKTTAKHYSFAEQTSFLKQLLDYNLDLLHLTNFNGPILYPKKTVITIHDLTLHFYHGKRQNSLLHRLAYRLIFWRNTSHASAIITVSKTTKTILQSINSKLTNKINAILLGISKSFVKSDYPKITDYEIPGQYLLYTGNWRQHKNTERLIQAFAKIKKDYNYQGSLVITGQPRPDYPNLPQLAKKLGVKESVVFPGYLPSNQLPTLFRNADAYILPSLMEGFGLPLLESMQTQTPVVCANTPIHKEIAKDAAIYFDPENIDDMAEKINNVLSNPTLQKDLIKKGDLNLQRFSYNKMASETLKLYQENLPS